MPQSLSQMYVHLVFSTKYRQRIIQPSVESGLHAYIAGILNYLESPSLQINSVPDHIHILFRLSKNYPLAKVVEIVKKESSKWMKAKGIDDFKWQIGYAAFSISRYNVEMVRNYIARQKEHHGIKSFKEEVEEIVREYEVDEYDEKYFWE